MTTAPKTRETRPGEVQPQGRGRKGEGRLQEVAHHEYALQDGHRLDRPRWPSACSGAPVLARRMPSWRLVDAEDERRENDLAAVGSVSGPLPSPPNRGGIRRAVYSQPKAAPSLVAARSHRESTGTADHGCRLRPVRWPRRSQRSGGIRASRISRPCCHSSLRMWRATAADQVAVETDGRLGSAERRANRIAPIEASPAGQPVTGGIFDASRPDARTPPHFRSSAHS